MSRVVIVGAGQAGGQAAAFLARNNFPGEILLLGEEPLAPYERPPLSTAVLQGARQPADGIFASAALLCELGVELQLGRPVAALDPGSRTLAFADGGALTYDQLLLTTGARPRALPLPGAGLDGVFLLRRAEDARAIAARLRPGAKLAVIGGGFIGLEVAASARQRGCHVTVVEAAPRILGRSLPAEAAAAMAGLHQDMGVKILTGASIAALEGDASDGNGRLRGIALADGRLLPAEIAVVGIGITPETTLARQAGLAVDDGIITDEFSRSSDPQIFAAGDCARAFLPRYGALLRLESYQNANLQAENVARSILGEASPYDPVPWLWSDHYGWTLQTAGFPALAEEVIQRGGGEDGKRLFFSLQGGKLIGIAGLGKGAAVAKDVRLAQMMMERGLSPDLSALADPGRPLKKLLVVR